MRTLPLLCALLTAQMLLGPAMAQVSVDQRALDQLAPAKPSSPPATAPKPATSVTSQPTAPKPTAPTAAAPASAAPQRPVVPPVATLPPPDVSLPPPIAVPTRPAAPIAAPPVTADSPTTTERRKDGLRIVFGAGRSDLSAAAEAEIARLVQGDSSAAPTPETASYTVTSFSAGKPEDPSTPRRLSLARALAVRSTLMTHGVASVRIYVRALGPASPGFADGPPDRADIVVAANPVPAPAPAVAAAKH